MPQCVSGHGDLSKVTKDGIEIDFCPVCGGVWLDHGELEKLLELARKLYKPIDQNMAPNLDFSGQTQAQAQSNIPFGFKTGNNNQNNSYNQYPHKKKKEGFLDDLFDIF